MILDHLLGSIPRDDAFPVKLDQDYLTRSKVSARHGVQGELDFACGPIDVDAVNALAQGHEFLLG